MTEDEARKVIAFAERARANRQKVKSLIETALGLPIVDSKEFDFSGKFGPPNIPLARADPRGNWAQSFHINSPTGKTIASFELWWDEQGNITLSGFNFGGEDAAAGDIFWLEDVNLQVKELNLKNRAEQAKRER
jgi:hypothetical protein